ncbi:hypothetical protein R70211_01375 [Paraburkholderia domus]|uniref:Uncharacterized protein n=1 Tax=Paraburkholderia domus TaxID=2793075 RepID=A0A9N8MMS0_9BURK|nr:hypothetical protein R70211_01375 [Paraburkholderia domus]
MSVLFVAGKGLKRLDEAVADDLDEGDGEGEDIITVPAWPDLPYLTEGLDVGATYKCSQHCWFSFGRRFHFYEQFERLADFANYEQRPPGADQTGAFRELFRRGDFFGPVVSAKLAADFSYWDPLARAGGILDESFYEHYDQWREMFKFAANDGALWLRCS